MEESKVLEKLERIEKKQDSLMESVAVILNYLMGVSIKEGQNSDDEKKH